MAPLTITNNNTNTELVSYCNHGIKSNKLQRVALEVILNQIKTPDSIIKGKINSIRDKINGLISSNYDNKTCDLIKTQIDVIKKSLPYFNLGLFNHDERKNNNFSATRYLLFDFDKISSLQEKRKIIENNELVFCCFLSPTGTGLKVILILDKPITDSKQYEVTYRFYMKELENYFGLKPDNTVDCSRTCFISYDKDIYLNYECKTVKSEIDIKSEKGKSIIPKEIKKSPAYRKYFNGVREGERHKALISLAGLLIKRNFRKDLTYEFVEMWNNRNTPPLDNGEISRTIDDLYTRYSTGQGLDSFIDNELEEWEFIRPYMGKEEIQCEINYVKYKEYLEKNGFHYHEIGEDSFYVLVKDNIVEIVNQKTIKDFLLKQAPSRIYEHLIIKYEQKLFTKSKMDFLSKLQKNIYKNETEGKEIIFFKNGFIEVTKDRITELKPFSDLDDCYIWSKGIIKRDFKLNTLLNIAKKSDYFQLLKNVTGDDKQRLKTITSAIGYLLYSYYKQSVTQAIVFVDEKIPDNPREANGRTGKTIVARSIGEFNGCFVEIDARNHKFDHNFPFQEVDHDTKVLYFDDAHPEFKFENLFSIISKSVTVTKKYRTPFKVDNVKILISTNHVLKNEGDSYEARKLEIEFSPYYSSKYTPNMEFRHDLLNKYWHDEQWELFDNFMLFALMFYLKKGLLNYKKVNLQERQMRAELPGDFIEYMKDKKVVPYQEYSRSYFYSGMIAKKGFTNIRSNTFKKWLERYGYYNNWKYDERPSTGNLDKWFWYYENDGERKKVAKCSFTFGGDSDNKKRIRIGRLNNSD